MTEPTAPDRSKPRWGDKKGWVVNGARFSPEETQTIENLAHALGTTKDHLIRSAVLFYLTKMV